MDKKLLHMISFLLLVIGGLNWGLVGLFGFNLVSLIFGFAPVVEKLVYVVVGASAVYTLATHKERCKLCAGK